MTVSTFKRLKYPLLVFILGLLFGFVALEIGLRLVSLRFLNSSAMPEGDFRVLCLGASHTEGAGVEPESAYCHLLQEKLRQAGIAGARTYNFGRAGWNSNQILRALPGMLNQTKPHLVVAMVGEPNFSNLGGLHEYLADFESGGLLARLRGPLSNLRIARLLTLLADSRRIKWTEEKELGLRILADRHDHRDHPRKREALEKIFAESDGRGPRAVTAATALFHLTKKNWPYSREPIEWLAKGVAASEGRFNKNLLKAIRARIADPGGRPELEELQVLKEKMHLALRAEKLPPLAHKILFGAQPFDRATECLNSPDCLPHLARLVEVDLENNALIQSLLINLQNRKQYDAALSIIRPWLLWNPLAANEAPIGLLLHIEERMRAGRYDEERLKPVRDLTSKVVAEFPWLRPRLENDLDFSQISRWLAHDLSLIARLLREQNIKLIYQTLPPRRVPSLERRRVDQTILRVREAENIPLADTWAYFEEFRGKKLSADLSELFSNRYGNADGHLNEFGHAHLAERLMTDLRRYHLF